MRFLTFNSKNYKEIEYLKYLPEEVKEEIDIVSKVIPFKTNNYVVDYLIEDVYKRQDMGVLIFIKLLDLLHLSLIHI